MDALFNLLLMLWGILGAVLLLFVLVGLLTVWVRVVDTVEGHLRGLRHARAVRARVREMKSH